MSIVEVSKLAGVSIATVSRVINNHPYVSDRAVKAVNEAMADLGYEPRRSLRRKSLLRQGGKGSASQRRRRRLAVFGLVVPNVHNAFYPTIVSSFADAAEQVAHQIVTCCTHGAIDKQASAILQLIDHRVAGVALMTTTHNPPPVYQVRQLQAHSIPVVLWHRGVPGIDAPLLSLEFEQAARMAGQQLIQAGHRRIAFFSPRRGQGFPRYVAGLKQVLREAKSDLPDELIHHCQINGKPSAGYIQESEQTELALRRMLGMPANRRPTAIFCSWDPYAERLYFTLEKMGVRVPQDLSLISFGGNRREGGGIAQRLSAVTIDQQWAARKAVALLDDMVTGRRPLNDPTHLPIPLNLHPGQTSASPGSLAIHTDTLRYFADSKTARDIA